MQTQKREEIDLIEIAKVIWQSKFLITIIVSFFSICSILYSLSINNLYTSSALLQVKDSENNGALQNMSSSFGGLASLAGVSLPSSSSNKTDYVVETIKSRDFLKHLLTFDNVRENIFASESYDHKNKTIIYDSEIFNATSKKWVRTKPTNRNQIPSYLEIYRIYRKDLTISVDDESGFISLSFTHLSPKFANQFLNLIVQEVNLLSKERDLEESQSALNFLEEQLLEVRQNEIRESMYQLIESQLETKMLANVRKDYLISFIDESYIPEVKSYPKRAIIVLITFMVSLTFSVLLVLIRHFTFRNTN